MDIKQKASLFAISSAATLSASKFLVGYKSGSMAVITSGLDSMLDVFMSVMNLIAIRKAAEPADKNHLYGHGKIEDLAAIVQALVIIFAGAVVVYKACANFINNVFINYTFFDAVVMFLSIIFSFFISKRLRRVGEVTGSNSLKVDALHYATDLYSNSAAFAAILVSYYTGVYFFDNLFAVAIGGYIIFQALKILKSATILTLFPMLRNALESRCLVQEY